MITTDFNNNSEKYKNIILSYYEELISILNSGLDGFKEIEDENQGVIQFKDQITNSLNKQIEEVKNEAEKSINAMPWDKLVIAFFGETNAGKSTIIETFRILFDTKREQGKDGIIVGDGQQDFTKDYHDYELSIDGKPVVLIDVPGIEGEEAVYKTSIADALRRAHIVFYVQGHNKKPDEATAKKIKEYLSNWTKVYSIQNVRGAVSNYDEPDERNTLLTESVLKTEKLIIDKFKDILGEVYQGNIPIQGLLAMCAKADFVKEREDLIRSQNKALKYFSSPEEILKFSQFNTLIQLVIDLTNNFSSEIFNANKIKLVALAQNAFSKVSSIYNSNNNQLINLNNSLLNFKKKSIDKTNCSINKAIKQISDTIDIKYNDLEVNLSEALDNEKISDKEKYFNEKIVNTEQEIMKEIFSNLNNMKKEIQDNIMDEKKNLQGISSISINIPSSLFNFSNDSNDITKCLEDLNFGWEDAGAYAKCIAVFTSAGAMIGSAIPGFGTIVGSIVGAGIGLISQISLGKRRKKRNSKTKKKISEVMTEAKEKVKTSLSIDEKELHSQASELLNKINKYIDMEQKQINDIINKIKDIEGSIDIFIRRIQNGSV